MYMIQCDSLFDDTWLNPTEEKLSKYTAKTRKQAIKIAKQAKKEYPDFSYRVVKLVEVWTEND